MPTACRVCWGKITWLSISGIRLFAQLLAVRHSRSGSQYFWPKNKAEHLDIKITHSRILQWNAEGMSMMHKRFKQSVDWKKIRRMCYFLINFHLHEDREISNKTTNLNIRYEWFATNSENNVRRSWTRLKISITEGYSAMIEVNWGRVWFMIVWRGLVIIVTIK